MSDLVGTPKDWFSHVTAHLKRYSGVVKLVPSFKLHVQTSRYEQENQRMWFLLIIEGNLYKFSL